MAPPRLVANSAVAGKANSVELSCSGVGLSEDLAACGTWRLNLLASLLQLRAALVNRPRLATVLRTNPVQALRPTTLRPSQALFGDAQSRTCQASETRVHSERPDPGVRASRRDLSLDRRLPGLGGLNRQALASGWAGG